MNISNTMQIDTSKYLDILKKIFKLKLHIIKGNTSVSANTLNQIIRIHAMTAIFVLNILLCNLGILTQVFIISNSEHGSLLIGIYLVIFFTWNFMIWTSKYRSVLNIIIALVEIM